MYLRPMPSVHIDHSRKSQKSWNKIDSMPNVNHDGYEDRLALAEVILQGYGLQVRTNEPVEWGITTNQHDHFSTSSVPR